MRVVTTYVGTDTLPSVERVEFSDKGYAFDTNSSAGIGAKFITTAFVKIKVSKYLGSGWSTHGLADLVSFPGAARSYRGKLSQSGVYRACFSKYAV